MDKTLGVALLGVLASLPALAVAQTIEEVRHQRELAACAAQPEPQRKPCEDAVKAKISQEWKAEQARRRTSN